MKLWPGRKKINVLSPLEGYDLWAASYHKESNPIKNLSDTLIEKHLPTLTGKSFLDAGCGSGKFCAFAEKQGASKIVGFDLSPQMIVQAKANCPVGEFQCCDLSELSTNQTFDVIVCALVLAHISELKHPLENLLKSVRHGGVLIITDFHPYLTLMQARRTFKEPETGRVLEIQHHLHLFQDYFSVINAQNAWVQILEEPSFNNVPAVFAMRVIKN